LPETIAVDEGNAGGYPGLAIMVILAKRAYTAASSSDGSRYLIDRLWPRGVSKKNLRLTGWLRELAPSDELRDWFGHDPSKYATFREKYRRELERHRDLVDALAVEAQRRTVTIVFGARDETHSNASVLKELIEERARRGAIGRPRGTTVQHDSVPGPPRRHRGQSGRPTRALPGSARTKKRRREDSLAHPQLGERVANSPR
jgi:uncharacterized protein YeaO (DUF488 family)